ncbi:MAG: DUF421 domain-containing protein [Rhizobiaceae bacterium]|nr:DUF421 domain-containing protein [Rhizobiaceae bacterium]
MENWSDLFRIFFGEADTANFPFYLEVVLRTVVMYLYTIFLARMVGQGGIGQIGPFEFVLVIAVGSAAGDPMFYPEIGLLQGILVITVVILLHRGTGYVLERHRRLENAVEGVPLLVLEKGKVCERALGSGSVTQRELFSLLRIAGVRDTGEVERAYLEPSGQLSLFRYTGRQIRQCQSTLP